MRLFVCLFAALLLVASESFAQADPDPSTLPDIAPREFEIRGSLEISFPALRRQPLTGFNPPPRLYTIPPERVPELGEYRQRAADLPYSTLQRPELPPATRMLSGDPNRIRVELGAGSHLGRLAHAWFNVPFNDGIAVLSNLRFDASEGHRPFSDMPDLRAPYSSFDGLFGVQARRSSFSAGLELDAFSDRYVLYGADLFAGGAFANNQYHPQPERFGFGLGTTAWLRTNENGSLPLEARIRYGAARYSTDVFAAEEHYDPRFELAEKRLDLSSGLTIPFDGGAGLLNASFVTAGLDTNAFLGSDYGAYQVGGGVRFRHRNIFNITLGLQLAGFSTSDANEPNGRSARYVLPQAQLDVYSMHGLHLYVKNSPKVDTRGLHDLFRHNPYVINRPILRPTVHFLDTEGGLQLYVGPFRMGAHVGIQYLNHYLFFEQTSAVPYHEYRQGFFEAHYGSARIAHSGGHLSLLLPGGFRTTVQARLRSGRLTATEDWDATVIPHFSPLVGEAQLSYTFLDGQALVQLTGTMEGNRPADRLESHTLPHYIDLDLKGAYDFNRNVGAFVQLRNMAAGSRFQRWAGYPEPTYVVLAGVRLLR